MLGRITRGAVPERPHTALRDAEGALLYEHCLTRDGFAGPFSVLYHRARPQAFQLAETERTWQRAEPGALPRLRRRHLRPTALELRGESWQARRPLLFNEDVSVAWHTPTESDRCTLENADGDELLFIQSGRGVLWTAFGRLPFEPGVYLYVPKGVNHRFEVEGPQAWLSLEFRQRLRVPSSYRNEVGQLRMDAPYGERDFSLPEFVGPLSDGPREVLIKRDEALFEAKYAASPLDVVGFDGSVYPFCFPIRAFRPRVSSVHLPPTVHATFESDGVLVCSFVPRPLDFGEGAIPCPYPHSSVDIDEVLFYVEGDFTSRTGVGSGSLTWHPRGTPHGPQPGRYEASIGKTFTDEVAVMLDCQAPLCATPFADAVDDPDYAASFEGE